MPRPRTRAVGGVPKHAAASTTLDTPVTARVSAKGETHATPDAARPADTSTTADDASAQWAAHPPTHDEIEVRAYHIWRANMLHDSDPVSDWLEAERQLWMGSTPQQEARAGRETARVSHGDERPTLPPA